MAPARPLTRERIVDEALAMAHERGVDAVTLRPLAARLGVRASALYRHVANRDELVTLMHARLIDGRRGRLPQVPWDEGLRMLATGVWHVYAPYPGLAGEALTGSVPTASSRDRASDQVDALVAAGFPRDEAEAAVLAFVQWILMFLASIDRLPPPETRIHEMPDVEYAGARDIYDRGVDLMLDGLRQRLERHRG
jgi:AcrR family transcriptional regulator